jgi:GNAT superfamily N-acetyltransferase
MGDTYGGKVLDQIVDAWCRSLPADPITLTRLRDLVILDAGFDPDGLRVARDGDRILGAAYAVRVHADGWVPFFFVVPEARGRGIGRALLTEALEWLRAHGAKQATFAAYAPGYVLPGCDRALYPAGAKLLESLGFETYAQAVAMDRSLIGYTPCLERLDGLAAVGWRFGTPTVDDLPGLLRLAGEHFAPDWAQAIRQAIRGGLPLERIVVAVAPGGDLAGWAMHGAYENVAERFGPFGVRGDRRGLGLGEVLLHLTLARMRALGLHTAWFLWTGEQTPAGSLYRKAGFTTTRFFDLMRSSLA